MSPSQQQAKRLRQKNVSIDELDLNVSKTWMTDHLRVNKPSCSPRLSIELEFKKGAECVEGGSVAMRSSASQHSRYHPVDYSGILSYKTVYQFEADKSVPLVYRRAS